MDCILISVHGIRTFGQWQQRLEALLTRQKAASHFEVDNIDYGYFSVIAFFFPFVRALATRRIRKLLLRTIGAHPDRRVYIVAHSFGTHLVAWALRGLTVEQRSNIRIHTIIFAGSVLHPRFRWDDLLDERSGCVHRVVNDCGTRDVVLLFSQLLVPLASMAGRVGFRGVINERFRNRYFPIGHSGYFMTDGKPNDFMEKWWLPLLTTDQQIEPHDERRTGALAGLATFLINNAEPLKMLGYLGASYFFIYAPIRELNLKAERSQRMELVTRLAEAATRVPSGATDSAPALLLARQAFLYDRQFGTRRQALVDRALRTAMSRSNLSVTLRDSVRDFTSADVSANGKWLAIAEESGLVWLWNLDSAARVPIGLPYHGGVVRAVRFRPDSKQLIAVTDAGNVLSWDALDGERKFRQYVLPVSGGMQIVAISADAARLATAMDGGRIAVYQLSEPVGSPVMLCCHTKPVTALAFHPTLRDVVISGGMDETVRLWRWSPNQMLLTQWNGHEGPISALAWNRDGLQLAVGTGVTFAKTEGTVLIGRPLEQPFYMQKRGQHRGAVSAVAFSGDGGVLASAGAGDRNITLRQIGNVNAEAVQLPGHQGVVTRLVFDPQGHYMISIAAGSRQTTASAARLWYLNDPPASPRVIQAHETAVVDMAFAPNRALLASVGGFDRTLTIYDVDRGLVVGSFSHDEAAAESVRFDPDGTAVATGSGSVMGSDPDFRLRVWDLGPGHAVPRRVLGGFKSDVKSLAFSGDGHWLAASGHLDREIRLWDLRTGSDTPAIVETEDTQLLSMTFDPRSPLLAWAGSDANLYVRLIGGRVTSVLRGHARPITSLSFTPDGSRILSGDTDGKIFVWSADARRTKPLAALKQPSAVRALAVNADGPEIASGGDDGVVRIWDADAPSSGYNELGRGGRGVTALSLSPDRRYLAAGYVDGRILLWPTTASLAEQACAIAQRNLTPAEWAESVGEGYQCTCPGLPPCGPKR